MTHQIFTRWPAQHPEKIQLFSYPTPNGKKVSIALEEMALDYEPHLITLADADVKSPEFLALNPNNKIPAIIDPDGPDGAPIELWESGAILIYLAEKSGQFYGSTAHERHMVNKWLMFQMGGLGPMLGQLGFFYKFAGSQIEDKRPQERFINEARRLLTMLNSQLNDRQWIAGDYSIADMAIVPWLAALDFYGAKEVVGWPEYQNLERYLTDFMARPAVQKGLTIPNPTP